MRAVSFQLSRVFLAFVLIPAFAGCGSMAAMTASSGDDDTVTVRNLSLSAAALNDYQGTYALDKPNKAFAVSPDGAFAAAHSFPTQSLATASALLNCNQRVRSGQAECYIYDANGVIIAQPPFKLKLR